MNDILLYIIVFGLIIVFYYVYSYRKERIKTFKLSETFFSYGTLLIKIKKKGSIVTQIIIKPYLKDNQEKFDIKNLTLEVLRDNAIKKIELLNLKKDIINDNGTFIIDFNSFKDFLKENSIGKNNFRFVISNKENSKILKSKYLSTGKYLDIYLPDMGKYN